MKRFLPYILIVLIFLQLLAPFSVGGGIKNNLGINTNIVEAAKDGGTDDITGLPVCVTGVMRIHMGGCIAQGIYYLFFKTTSFLFAGAGKVLDFTLMYSISDTSYRSSFVVQGWGIVRDFCNMFFIFVLLYIAFGTILKLHSVKTKEMIINVVIIGLLINFSLFATQVIIDASNILTRVFYNQKTIITGAQQIDTNGNPVVDTNGKPVLVNKLGEFGEIKLSEAIVSKVDPQKLIIQASEVSKIKQKTLPGETEETYGKSDISVGSFILVTLLATIVNVVGIIAFISSAIIFIARVLGLWLAMILAPIAFFTYTIPALQDIEMIGWKRWWPETLKLAFLAPIFAFFMYLIVGFMPKALDVFKGGSTAEFHGINFVVGIIVPFIFIMILLMKSKDIAKSMSGKIGQSITNVIAAAGGMALGGAALGAAALGRGTIGAVAKYTQNDAARKKDINTFGGYKDWSLGKKLNPFAYVGQVGKTATAGIAAGIHKIPAGKDAAGIKQTLGQKIKGVDEGFGHKTHAQHILDAKMQSEFGHQYGKDAKFKDLSEHEQEIVKKEVDKDEMAKKIYGKLFKDLEAPQAKEIQDRYDAGERAIDDGHGKTIAVRNPAAKDKIKSDYITGMAKAPQAMGEFVQSLRKGSMDIRNISETKAVSKGFPKMAVGLAAILAGGVRMGLKSGVNVNPGTGQKDFLKDIGSTVTEALKGVKVNVSTGGGHDDSGHKEVKSVGH